MFLLPIPEPDRMMSVDQYYNELPRDIRGVYLLEGKNGKLLYIGKSNDLRGRIRTHLTKNEIYKEECVLIKVYFIESQIDMDIFETYLINVKKPIHNKDKVFKDSSISDTHKIYYLNSNITKSNPPNRYRSLIQELNRTNENLLRRDASFGIEYEVQEEGVYQKIERFKKVIMEKEDTISVLNKEKRKQIEIINNLEKMKKEKRTIQLQRKSTSIDLLKLCVDNDLLRFELEDSKALESQYQKEKEKTRKTILALEEELKFEKEIVVHLDRQFQDEKEKHLELMAKQKSVSDLTLIAEQEKVKLLELKLQEFNGGWLFKVKSRFKRILLPLAVQNAKSAG